MLALGGLATIFLVRATSTDIPQVANIASSATGGSIRFSWTDPGLKPGDSYVVTSGTDTSTQTATSFVAPAQAGQQVCISVTVNRAGKNGPASAEKCATPEGSR